MEYTEQDVMQAIIVALEWAESGVGIAALDERESRLASPPAPLYPGAGAALTLSPAAVELLASAQAAIDRERERGAEPYLARESHGIRHYDYTGV